MASIRKVSLENGSTRWRMRVFMGQDPTTGRKRVVTKTFHRKTDAEREARRLEGFRDQGRRTPPSREPLTKYLQSWLVNTKQGRVRDRTFRDYRSLLRRHVFEPSDGTPPIGSIRMDQLTPRAFEELYTWLWREQGISPRTLEYLHSVIRQALTHAVNTGALGRNPTDGVKPPRQPAHGKKREKAMRAMSKEEADRFLEAAFKDERHTALWVVLLMGGLRPGEAFGLRWEDVDFGEGRWHVRRSRARRGVAKRCSCGHAREYHSDNGNGACATCNEGEAFQKVRGWRLDDPKTPRARRVVVLPELAVDALRALRVRQAKERLELGSEYVDRDFVFTSSFGSPLDPSNTHRMFKKVLETAELGRWEGEGRERRIFAGFRLYDLRHTCATLLLRAGENAKVVSERLGHASVTLTLDTYSHVLPDMQEGSATKLQEMFG